MKNIILLFIFVTFINSVLSADYAITRGPEIGEIYFIGPTVTGEGIYRSTDFGEIATCMDSSYYYDQIECICADLTPGSVYITISNEVLYYSNNYGQTGSWVFRYYPVRDVSSGRNEGALYNRCLSHSEDYGINFIQHQNIGLFGFLKTTEIDNDINKGYTLVYQYGILDSMWLLFSTDNFENFNLQYSFDFQSIDQYITRGTESGELYLYTQDPNGRGKELQYSSDYGQTWELKKTFNCPNLPMKGIVGGRQPGELYIIFECIQLAFFINHIYIYHSLDYGETFTTYHPIAIGPEPYYANFEATPTTGTAPLTVQFTDLSSGEDIWSWEWDFNDDGIIDSYEQNPEYTYQDTGSYTVRLKITAFAIENEAYRKDYINVTTINSYDNEIIELNSISLSNYPNPFNPSTIISYKLPQNRRETAIEIYNTKGQLIEKLSVNNYQSSIEWNAEELSSGIYFYKLNVANTSIKKMILLK